MSSFSVKIRRVAIEPHPNADAIELAQVDGYQSIVAKGQYKTGDLVAYIPEQAVLPEWLIQALNLEGKLAGKNKNRVKPVKLRGVVSQGLCYPVEHHVPEKAISNALKYLGNDGQFHHQVVQEGEDVTELLGIEKYEPPIPVHMAGEVYNAHGMTINFDVENIKSWPNVLQEGEDVVVTEKLHGSWCCYGFHPDLGMETPIITSKGLSSKGLALKINDANKNNIYMRAFENLCKDTIWGGPITIVEQFKADARHVVSQHEPDNEAFYLLGEVAGPGIQKNFDYGLKQVQFYLFDVAFIKNGSVCYVDDDDLDEVAKILNINKVPILYRGPYSDDLLERYTSGTESISNTHIREGIVITPCKERYDSQLGRVKLKSVSDQYLLSNGTDYN